MTFRVSLIIRKIEAHPVGVPPVEAHCSVDRFPWGAAISLRPLGSSGLIEFFLSNDELQQIANAQPLPEDSQQLVNE